MTSTHDAHERMWQTVVDADLPTADEMARAEEAMRACGPVDRLSAEQIERMVAATVAPRPVLRTHAFRRLLAVAAVAVVSLSLVAWFGRTLVWREGQHARATLDFSGSVQLAVDASQPEQERINALGRLTEACSYVLLPALRTLCADTAPAPLGEQARKLRSELRILLANRTVAVTGEASSEPEDAARTALDTSLPMASRQRALEQLGLLCAQAIHVFNTSDLKSDVALPTIQLLRTNLSRGLAD